MKQERLGNLILLKTQNLKNASSLWKQYLSYSFRKAGIYTIYTSLAHRGFLLHFLLHSYCLELGFTGDVFYKKSCNYCLYFFGTHGLSALTRSTQSISLTHRNFFYHMSNNYCYIFGTRYCLLWHDPYYLHLWHVYMTCLSLVVVDRFYIALFSALEQTHCARMWFCMSE